MAVSAKALGDGAASSAGREENERAGTARSSWGGIGREPLENGQGECGGLAGAGLRDADEIASLQKKRDGLGLDGRRFGVAF